MALANGPNLIVVENERKRNHRRRCTGLNTDEIEAKDQLRSGPASEVGQRESVLIVGRRIPHGAKAVEGGYIINGFLYARREVLSVVTPTSTLRWERA